MLPKKYWMLLKTSNNRKTFSLAELAKSIGADLEGDGSVLITGVAPIESAEAGSITFVANSAYEKHIATTKASAIVLAPEVANSSLPTLRHKDPYLTFASIIDLLYPPAKMIDSGVDAMAVISKTAIVDTNAGIGAFCQVGDESSIGSGSQLLGQIYVGSNVAIGTDCLIYPGVKIMDGCIIGNRVILHPGVVIGSDGFGFAPTATGLRKIQQIGWVEIADDVEIGSNTTIDCGAIGPTRIGRGTKIDNLVQIAHNVQIGEHSIIVSQVGISGSTKIGNGCVLAGQVGVVGHIEIGDGAVLAAQAGVTKSIKAGQTVYGSPAREIMEGKRIEASLRRLPDLLKRVKKIETKLDK